MREELLDAFERIAANRFFARRARIGFSVHTRLNSPPDPAPHDDQLMSEHRVLSFEPQLRLEWLGQDGQKNQRDHRTNLADSSLSKPG
jgi:hypothetical protein